MCSGLIATCKDPCRRGLCFDLSQDLLSNVLKVKGPECQPRRRHEGSQPAMRRGDTPQRRHLVTQDHLLWSGAISAIPEVERPQGLRRSSPSPTLDSQIASLLADPSKEQRKQALQLDLSTQSTGYVRASSAGASANLRGSKVADSSEASS
eukprot:symbB.v1.2.020969.t1/scaffold1791.1/size101237/9